MPTKVEVVFRRKVRAIWLDQGLALAANGTPWNEAKPEMVGPVAAENPGAETIRKVLEHVRRIWFEPPENCTALRAAAFEIFRSSNSKPTRALLNWGMASAAYPFVGSVAEAFGRLLKLQARAHRTDVQRRMREQYGDRDFVSRITRYVISSFLDWGIVTEEKQKHGIYVPAKRVQIQRADQAAWLVEAVLVSRGKTQMSFSQLLHHPIVFPFLLETIPRPHFA